MKNKITTVPAQGLDGNDEPEYTLDDLTEINPEYAGLRENADGSIDILAVPVRGLAAAYGDDEPEYTLDTLESINPEYKGPHPLDEILAAGPRGIEAAFGNDEHDYSSEEE